MASSGPDTLEKIKRLLGKTVIIRTACDLDLLVFLYRHPRMLLTSERLAEFVGYELRQIAKSLETLIENGLLNRTQNPTTAARLYVFVLKGEQGGWFRALAEIASTRKGRQQVLGALASPEPSATSSQLLSVRRSA